MQDTIARTHTLTIHSCSNCPFAVGSPEDGYRCRRKLNEWRTGYREIEFSDEIPAWCPLETDGALAHLTSTRAGLTQALSSLEGLLAQPLTDAQAADRLDEMEALVEMAHLVSTYAKLTRQRLQGVAHGTWHDEIEQAKKGRKK